MIQVMLNARKIVPKLHPEGLIDQENKRKRKGVDITLQFNLDNNYI